MIEKARRTKINEALAALRAMVPADHGSQEREDREDDEVRDGEEWVAVKDRERAKDKGKKEEKEKEFKLEILVRAVSFMEDLIVKVRDMEAARNGMCSNCQGPSGAKRKRSTGVLDGDGTARRLHILRANMDDDTQVSCRLPSISSWLPHTRVDPSYVPSSPPLHDNVSYLPSPPSSTRSRPVPTVRLPPKLALDAPCAIPPDNNPKLSPGSSLQFSPEEDESAASLLLRISVSSSWSPSLPSSTSTVSSTDLAQSAQSRHLGLMHQTENPAIRQAQTPSSLLGMSSARIKT
jgi:hypothetical protein